VARNALSSLPLPAPSLTAVRIMRIRGHAAKNCLGLFATGRAVTKRCVCLAAAKLVTAVMRAAKTYGACWIVNVSGWRATVPRGDSSVSSNIRPGVAWKGRALPRFSSRW
jgi:hypothetical protein